MKEAIAQMAVAMQAANKALDDETRWKIQLKKMVKERFDTVKATPGENDFLLKVLGMF